MRRILVFIPTYNEKDNVARISEEILALGDYLDILFVDDSSPDGTGRILDEISSKHPQVKVVHRPGRQGIGSAHLDGIRWAYDHNYQDCVTMDCDFTHSPSCILDILKCRCDVAIGSRYQQENSLEDWAWHRKFMTIFAHALTRILLKLPHDASNGFRYYCLNRIPKGLFDLVSSKGYSFFFESLYILKCNHFSIEEIPIKLPSRVCGQSKMTLGEIGRSAQLLLSMSLRTRLMPGRYRAHIPAGPRPS